MLFDRHYQMEAFICYEIKMKYHKERIAFVEIKDDLRLIWHKSHLDINSAIALTPQQFDTVICQSS